MHLYIYENKMIAIILQYIIVCNILYNNLCLLGMMMSISKKDYMRFRIQGMELMFNNLYPQQSMKVFDFLFVLCFFNFLAIVYHQQFFLFQQVNFRHNYLSIVKQL